MTGVRYQRVLQACIYFSVRPQKHSYVLRHNLGIIALPPGRYARCRDLPINSERILRFAPFEQSHFYVDGVPLRSPCDQTVNVNLLQDPGRQEFRGVGVGGVVILGKTIVEVLPRICSEVLGAPRMDEDHDIAGLVVSECDLHHRFLAAGLRVESDEV